MNTSLRFALAGCGSIAPTHARALASLTDAALVACTDALPERARAFAAEFGPRPLAWADVLADPDIDAVTVCAPSGLHAALGVQALRAGKHVVVEKPMDISLAACDALLAAQRESGRRLAVISQHRFDRASRAVRAALDDGLLGDLILVDARIPWYRTQEYYDSGDWRGTWALDGGGCLMNQGVHTVDLLRWLAGPAVTVYAQARTAAHIRLETEDAITATLTFASGAIGTLMASTAAYPGFPARLALHGTRGSAVIEGDALQTLAIQGRETVAGEAAIAHAVQVATGGTKAATTLAPPELGAGAWGEAHRAQLADFLQCCRTGATPQVDGTQGRNAVELVLACYESARTGQVVMLPGARP
ncbi:MAG: Gfo/Idh/MocA family oxidoreductase [Armatimonadetes bacterium]|nr:Gfo/Idh/MocA family oxidoreductase [Armatimonadota bacterium]